jgi:Pyruvate phosphate dikinase, AMP/ATP-binding domain
MRTTPRKDAVPFVYAFDHPHETKPKNLAHLLGGKGANLAEMTSVLSLPVPPGFTITTDACAPTWPTSRKWRSVSVATTSRGG